MKYIRKNITTVKGPCIIIHGVNCQKEMKSGVAKALYTRWPQTKEIYKIIPKQEMTLGKIHAIQVELSTFVIHFWTQESFGYDGKRYASKEAIKECLMKVSELSMKLNINTVYSPKIGSGLGGLSWEKEVKPIFESIIEIYPH